ncbi:uncharacterized protein LOC141713919 [Apium graveolens]|uniref:uncharacterized protein LOC141713919 n=1 Tax=Apium graveolens TaxID=4045 RepID=UPI003D79CCCD
MEMVGHPFTWERGRDTENWMKIRLDRALTNTDWLNMFPMAKLYNLESTSNDHSPNLLVPQYRGRRDVKSTVKYKEARDKLTNISNQREIFWRQRSKQLWFRVGDRNSKYFHWCASTRRRNNQINKLKNDDGQWMEWENGLRDLMSDYCLKLFAASEIDWREVVSYIPTKVTRDQNDMLLQQVMVEEVKQALFQMNSDKALGLDGMTPGFY